MSTALVVRDGNVAPTLVIRHSNISCIQQLFLQSLPGPNNKPCLILAAGCICSTNEGTRSFASLRREAPKMLDACTRFITKPESDDVRNAVYSFLETRISDTCACDRSDPLVDALHRYACSRSLGNAAIISVVASHRDDAEYDLTLHDLAWVFMTACVDALNVALAASKDMTKSAKRVAKASSAGKRPLWPRDLSEVLPYGVEASLHTATTWILMFPHPSLLALFNHYTHLADSTTAQRAIISYPALSSRFITISNATLDILEQEQAPFHEIQDALAILETCAAFLKNFISALMEFTADFFRGYGQRPDTLPLHCSRAFACLEKLEARSRTRGEGVRRSCAAIREGYGRFGAVMQWAISGRCERVVYHPDFEREVARFAAHMGRVFQTSSPFGMVHYAVGGLLKRMACFNLECTGSAADVGHKLQKCSGCQCAVYCSRECQQVAWRHLLSPHQACCAVLKRVQACREGLAEKDNAGFKRKAEQAGLLEDDMMELLVYLEALNGPRGDQLDKGILGRYGGSI